VAGFGVFNNNTDDRILDELETVYLHLHQGHREFPFQDCKIPPQRRKVRIFAKIHVIEITTLHHQVSNILFN